MFERHQSVTAAAQCLRGSRMLRGSNLCLPHLRTGARYDVVGVSKYVVDRASHSSVVGVIAARAAGSGALTYNAWILGLRSFGCPAPTENAKLASSRWLCLAWPSCWAHP